MTSPVYGFTYPNARTWSKNDQITTPRLRGDMQNLAYLYCGGARPMFLSLNEQGQIPSGGGRVPLFIGNIVPLNTWNVNTGATPISTWDVPFAGYYLVQGDVTFNFLAGTPNNNRYLMGFSAVSNGAGAVNIDAGSTAGGSTGASFAVGTAGMELFQMNTFANTADTLAMYALTSNTASPGQIDAAGFMIEWVALPTSGLTSYTGPYGTVVSSPVAAAQFPSGPGTTVTAPVTAGATSITVVSNTGMITGGTLGLDFTAGMLFQPVAEVVSITSVAGTTIGISAAQFPHSSGSPVAVPNSAAFLNQQDRDIVNFLAYPPMLRATQQSTQGLTAQTFPAGTQITSMGSTIDNFSGFASNAYTAPVTGTYLVYGQVAYAGTASACVYSAGLSVNGGTVQWGTTVRTVNSVGALAMTVRRVLRLTKGQTVTLFGSTSIIQSTVVNSDMFSKLICVFRSF